jgi:hypothetical protein
MTPEQQEALRRQEDIHVRQPEVTNTGSNLQVTFKVVNASNTPARNVSGAMRFWFNDRIVYNLPFQIERLPAKSQQPMTLTAPIFEFTRFQGYVTARPDNAGL